MRTRIVVVVFAACTLSAASHVLAQWTPRKIVRPPQPSGPTVKFYRANAGNYQRGPVQFRRANTSGPIVRNPLTPRGGRSYDTGWHSAEGAPSVGYRAYDTAVSDFTRGYDHTPGIGEGRSGN
jgi:hypothetical protein